MKKRRIFSVFCIYLLIFSFLTLSGCYSKNENLTASERKISIQTVNFTIVQNGENPYVEQTVKANIAKSESYTDYLIIDWFLSWEKDSNEDISQYVRISESSNDSSLCYVRCYKSFKENNIILTAKIKNSNVQDSCLIVFEGVPSSFNLNINSFYPCDTIIINGKTIYLFEQNKTYYADFIYNNIFQDVNEKIFLEYCDIQINSYGKLKLRSEDHIEEFDLIDFVGPIETEEFDSIDFVGSTKDDYTLIMNYSFDSVDLIFETIYRFPNNAGYFVANDNYTFDEVVNTLEDLPYLEFIVTDKTYGFSTNFYIGFELI